VEKILSFYLEDIVFSSIFAAAKYKNYHKKDVMKKENIVYLNCSRAVTLQI